MTISGRVPATGLSSRVELIPAAKAQDYLASLELKLIALDGGPVYLVHDKETSTSDNLVSEFQDAFMDGKNIESLPLVSVLNFCFKNRLNFRVWRADNDMNAYLKNSNEVKDVGSALESIKNQRGAWWHAH